MTPNDPKLEELKQRSHDYALWFIDAIFGAFAILFFLAGGAAVVFGALSLRFGWLSLGCGFLIGGSLLFVLLAILRTLKDIRLNSREILKLSRTASPITDNRES